MKAINVMRLSVLLAGGMALFNGAQGHHSVSAEFDSNSEVTLTGKVTELQWTNPHSWVLLDVENEAGEMERWQCEMGAPNRMVRRGWLPEDLPLGTEVVITGILAWDGSNTCNVDDIKSADGKPFFEGDGPHA